MAAATTATARILNDLKLLVVSGELGPGEQIRQEEMADKLSVSRVPLREAMNVLADRGLLAHRPNQGYFVVKRAPAELVQIRRMLDLLENELMATIQLPGAAVLRELRALNAEMRDSVKANDVRHLIEVNRRFHFRIFGLSPAALIVVEVGRLWSMVEPAMWVKYEHSSDRKATLVEHDRIVAALTAGDRVRAVAEMQTHRTSGEFGRAPA